MLNRKSIACAIILLALPVLLIVASSTTLAQSTATLQGTVTDQKGAVVPNATVTVRNRATSFERTVQTDSDGNYQVAALPVGNYTVDVKVQGFKTNTVDLLPVEVARTIVQNFQLNTGSNSRCVNFRLVVIRPEKKAARLSERPLCSGASNKTQSPEA